MIPANYVTSILNTRKFNGELVIRWFICLHLGYVENIGVGTVSKVGRLKLSAMGSGGAPVAPPAGSGAEPQLATRGSGGAW